MARIRTVKPEFWEDEAVGALSRDARLLFIASWNMADDEGLLRWSPDYLKAHAFSYDTDMTVTKVTRLMGELETGGFVFPYIAGRTNQRLAFIIHFRKHQRINRPQPGKLPPPSVQSRDVIAMYGRRDQMRCGICGETIRAVTDAWVNVYDADPDNHHDEQVRQQLSLDHITPRSKGGTDYPSNIQASHLKCNKGRGNRDLPGSLPDAVTESVNHSLAEGNREQGRDEEGNASSSPTDSPPSSAPSEDDDRIEATAKAVTDRRERRTRPDVPDRWRPVALADQRKQATAYFAEHPTATVDQAVRDLDPGGEPKASKVDAPPPAAQPPEFETPEGDPDYDLGRAELARIRANSGGR